MLKWMRMDPKLFHLWNPIEHMEHNELYDSIHHESYKHIAGLQGMRHERENQDIEAFDWVDFTAGFLAGCAGVVFGHPLDTIKVRQQTLGKDYGTIAKCAANTIQHEGATGFYKGLLFPLSTEGARNCLFFGVYERFKGDNENVTYARIALAGAIGGGVQALLGSPVELVKVQLQNQTARDKTLRTFRGPLHCVTTIMRNHTQQISRGLMATIYRDTTGFAVYMTSYEYLCRRCNPKGPEECSVPQLFVAGGVAGSLSWFCNLPIDTVKSRIQGDSLENPVYRGFTQCLNAILKEEGFRALFRGLPAVLMRAFALNAVTLTTYSLCRQQIQLAMRENVA